METVDCYDHVILFVKNTFNFFLNLLFLYYSLAIYLIDKGVR